jgi:hypothetical protein
MLAAGSVPPIYPPWRSILSRLACALIDQAGELASVAERQHQTEKRQILALRSVLPRIGAWETVFIHGIAMR